MTGPLGRLRLARGTPNRSRCGATVYLGSVADAVPAWNRPKRVAQEPIVWASPPAASSTRWRRTAETARRPAPIRVDHEATFMKRPAFPCCRGSPTIPIRLWYRSLMNSSARAPAMAMARAGPACAAGDSAVTSPAAPSIALAPNRYGISR